MIGIDQPAAEAPTRLADVRRAAKAALRSDIWDFIEGGSGAETTIATNRVAFDSVALLPRVLAGVLAGDTRGRLLNSEVAMPVAIAPMWLRDHEKVVELVISAEDLGCQALVVTVDVPIMGRRHRDVRNQFALPPDVRAVNLDSGPTEVNLTASGTSAIATHTSSVFAQGLHWRDLEWLRQRTALPLVVKGILDPRDARLAVECGADAVVVSKALGAFGVLSGRPVRWGLPVGGERGIAQVLSLLQSELREAMTLTGCADLAAAARLRRGVRFSARRSY